MPSIIIIDRKKEIVGAARLAAPAYSVVYCQSATEGMVELSSAYQNLASEIANIYSMASAGTKSIATRRSTIEDRIPRAVEGLRVAMFAFDPKIVIDEEGTDVDPEDAVSSYIDMIRGVTGSRPLVAPAPIVAVIDTPKSGDMQEFYSSTGLYQIRRPKLKRDHLLLEENLKRLLKTLPKVI